MDIPVRYQRAFENVLAGIESETEPVGIVLTGSVVHGNASRTSDLDVAILHDRTWRQRIQRVIDGVPVECFINSHDWWMHTLKSEAEAGRSPAAHFLARGVIWRDRDGRMRNLQQTAQQYVDAGPKVSTATLTSMKYAAVSTLEDGGDIATIDEDRSQWLLFDAIDKALRYHYMRNSIWIPREKDLFKDVEVRWPELGSRVRVAISATNVVERVSAAEHIVELTTGETRFFEWSSDQQELNHNT